MIIAVIEMWNDGRLVVMGTRRPARRLKNSRHDLQGNRHGKFPRFLEAGTCQRQADRIIDDDFEAKSADIDLDTMTVMPLYTSIVDRKLEADLGAIPGFDNDFM